MKLLAPLFLCAFIPTLSLANDVVEMSIVIKNHRFVTPEITAPAGKKIKLTVKNEGPGSEEFESTELKLEKIIPPGRSTTLTFGPLKPGEYKFFGEFHMETAQGKLIVK